MRVFSFLKFRWDTRHWNRNHFPGCPVRYGIPGECLNKSDVLNLCKED